MKKQSKTVSTSIIMGIDTLQWLDKECELLQVSRSEYIRNLIKEKEVLGSGKEESRSYQKRNTT